MSASLYFASGNTNGLTGLFNSFNYFEKYSNVFYFIVLYVPALGYGAFKSSFVRGGVLESVRGSYEESRADFRRLESDTYRNFTSRGYDARIVMFKWNNGTIERV